MGVVVPVVGADWESKSPLAGVVVLWESGGTSSNPFAGEAEKRSVRLVGGSA